MVAPAGFEPVYLPVMSQTLIPHELRGLCVADGGAQCPLFFPCHYCTSHPMGGWSGDTPQLNGLRILSGVSKRSGRPTISEPIQLSSGLLLRQSGRLQPGCLPVMVGPVTSLHPCDPTYTGIATLWRVSLITTDASSITTTIWRLVSIPIWLPPYRAQERGLSCSYRGGTAWFRWVRNQETLPVRLRRPYNGGQLLSGADPKRLGYWRSADSRCNHSHQPLQPCSRVCVRSAIY